MSSIDITRRRFLGMLAGLLGGGSAAGWVWGNRNPATTATSAAPADVAAAGSPTPTQPAPDSAVPATTAAASSSSTPAPATTAPPTSTTAPTTTVPPSSSTTTTTTPTTTTVPPSTTTLPPTTTTAVAAGSGSLQAICKQAWGGREAAGSFTTHTIQRMTVHHTAAPLADNRKAPARIRSHQSFHIDGRGWADLAYHFVVDANGHIYEGRPVTAVGDTGTNYDPTGHFLVCAEGDFDQHAITRAQLAAVADVLAWGASHFGVDPSTIRGHRDWAAISCPGAAFYPLITDGALEQAVRERMAAGAPSLSVLCGDAAQQRVADIEAGRI